jgi:hypothetical protein
MTRTSGPEHQSQPTRIGRLNHEFSSLFNWSRKLIEETPADSFYLEVLPGDENDRPLSLAENVLRGAAIVEQTFGGITANLWDDPFEWTLPETLNTHDRILEYLHEVEATRLRAFRSFGSDSELLKEVAVPPDGTEPLGELLDGARVRATDYLERAGVAAKTISAMKR